MHKRKWWMIGLILMISTLLIACSDDENNTNENNNNQPENNESGEASNNETEEEPEEVTIQFAYGWGEEVFEKHYKEPIEDALPHITLELVEVNIGLEDDVEELIAKGIVPDIWLGAGAEQLRNMKKFEMDFAIDELFEKHNFDWSRLDPNVEQFYRNQEPDKQMYMIPIYQGVDSLYYNKEIFDMFGVDYPTDNMTWEEVRDLAAEVTGEQNGVQYRGFDINSPQAMLDQRPVTHVDPETDEVLFTKDPIYAEYLHYLESLWSIPGILPEEDPGESLYNWGDSFFFGDHDIAMIVDSDRFANAALWEERGIDWDMVTMPVWEDQPDTISSPSGYILFPTRDPEHPDAVYEVLAHILSDEYQEWSSRTVGRTTVLADPEIQQSIAADIEGLEDKNVESIFLKDRNPGLPADEVSKYAGIDYNALYLGVKEFAELETDVNTFLRIMEEETEENIRSAKEIE